MAALPELNAESVERVALVHALEPSAHVYLLGICGTGMGAVASLLKQQGFRVTGTDKAFYPPMGPQVRALADGVFEGYDAVHLDAKPDLVVIGNNLSKTNEEVERVMAEGIPFASMPEVFAARLIGNHEDCATSVVVAGTHGKTTTTSMVATLFEVAGRVPGYFVGGVPTSLPSNVRAPGSEIDVANRVVVLEGDEYDSAYFAKWPKFHSYRPDIAVMTSLEFDHADIYETVEDIELEFSRLAARVPANGEIFVCDCSERLVRLAKEWQAADSIQARVSSYGEAEDSAFRILSRSTELVDGVPHQRMVFSLEGGELEVLSTETGIHNALNLLVASAVGQRRGLSEKQIAEGVAAFRGVVRRQQQLGVFNDIVVMEDFAHHPTAVDLTLGGLKEAYSSRRLVAVFEPRSNTSRRSFFQEQYAKSFSAADVVLLKEVESAGGYSGTSAEVVALDVKRLVSDLNAQGVDASSNLDIAELEQRVLQTVKPGDLLVFMSNGDFQGIVQRVVERLSSESS